MLSLQDLDPDIMRKILELTSSKISIRCVSTKFKATVEKMPGFTVVLSEEGMQNVTREFFLRFNEPIVAMKRKCIESSTCLSELCSAIRGGLIVQRIALATDINDDTALEIALGLKNCLHGYHANVGALEFGFTVNTVSLGPAIESIRQLSETYLLTLHIAISCAVPAPRYPVENEIGFSIGSVQRLDGFAEVRSLRLR